MYNPVADALKPRDNQLVRSFEGSNYYRPQSIQSKRYSKQSRPPSVTSSVSSNKRKIIIHRNGKKIEQLDQGQVKFKSDPPINRESVIKTDQVSQCSELELDQIPLDDPIWRQILPDNIALDLATLQRLIEENPDYFQHQLGLCACYRCKCGRCKCDVSNQLKYVNGPYQTIYEKDFIKQNLYNGLSPLNQTSYQTRFLDQKPIDQLTSNQVDYKEYPIQTQENFKPRYQAPVGSMSNLTSYRSNFGNWGTHYQKFLQIPHVSTSSDIKFFGRSSYQDSFGSPYGKVSEINNFKSQLSPLPTGPFMGMTTSQETFKPYTLQKKLDHRSLNKFETIPTFDGQFRSTGMRDFGPVQDDYCPANHYQKQWRKKLSQKYQKKTDSFIAKKIEAVMQK